MGVPPVAIAATTSMAIAIFLAGCASQPKLEPAAEPTQAEVSQSERLDAIWDCLEDFGWEVIDRSTGETRIPEEQLAQFEEDSGACLEQVDGTTEVIPLNDEQLTRLYGLEVAAAECLTGLGWVVEPPSLQTFIGTYYTGTPFTAHGSLGSLSQSEWKRATQDCPPPAWTLEQ